jgi:type 1 glutamine amidotransferase
MTHLGLLLLWSVASAPLAIDTTYPPPHDVRRPDRSLTGVAATALAYSPDGRTVATAASDGVVRLWNARTGEDLTGELVRTFAGARPPVAVLGFAADGKTLLAVGAAGVARWEVEGGKLLGTTALQGAGKVVALRPGQETQVAGATGRRVTLWNGDTGAVIRTFEAASIKALAFTPDGKRLATASDQEVTLWDPDSGQRTRAVKASGVRALAASATHLAAGLAGGKVDLWTLAGDDPARLLAGHRAAIATVAFSSKGEQLASAGADHQVLVWDVATGAQLCAQTGHTAAVQALAFNPNGQKMVSAGADRALRFWTVPLPPLAPADVDRITAALPARAAAAPKRPRKLLVFWRADAILHKGGVPAANKAIELLGKKTGAFTAEFSRDLEVLDPRVLARYDAVVFNSTAHLVIADEARRRALLDYVAAGGGVVGIHAAIDMFRTWPEGAAIVGATFGGHPWHPTGTWTVKLDQPDHPLLRAWGGKGFKMHDEFYELGEPYQRGDRRVLMSLDLSDPTTASVTPLHRKDRDFAVSWIKRHGQGRVFYGMFGHLADPFWNPAVLQFYLDGIQYVLGDLELSAAASAPPAPAAPPAASAPPGTPAPPR